jgi:gluconate 2-dehydrogenase gamma chain
MTQTPRNPRRRRFLKTAVSAAATGALVSCGRAGSQWRFFSTEEAKTVEAISERFIPADQDPGAAWAGVVRYIDRQLAVCFKFRVFRELYRQGLAGIDQTSTALFHARFVELTSEQQGAVLKALARGKPPGEIWKQVSAQQFFDMVLNHAMQGYYGDPRHGGNRDGVGWRTLGIPLTPVRGREQFDLRSLPRATGGAS